MIRIGCGQGFWGDWLEAPVRLVEQGPLDYLVLDYLAEVTMSILQKQRAANPNHGYARDFPPLIARMASQLKSRNVRVLANAGGVNPIACAQQLRSLAPDLKVAVVLGDDVRDRIDEFLGKGYLLTNLDTGEPLSIIRDRIQSANAYSGAFPLAEALATGADVVITGRCADAALALAPMLHHFHWGESDWDLLAAGVAAGHVVECGAQCTGGNCQADWQTIPDLANIGYPIIEAHPDGAMVITKHEGTGGRVSLASVKEQLVYEVHDPARYYTPDCIADFTSLQLSEDGPDRVRLSGTRGLPRPEQIKLSISYAWGWKTVGTLVYSWPQAYEKAEAADRIVRTRVADLGLRYDALHTEFLGYNACHGHLIPPGTTSCEVQLRMGMRGKDKESLERFTREVVPLVLNGPPTGTGYGEGRPSVREVVAYWPALVPRSEIQTRIEVIA